MGLRQREACIRVLWIVALLAVGCDSSIDGEVRPTRLSEDTESSVEACARQHNAGVTAILDRFEDRGYRRIVPEAPEVFRSLIRNGSGRELTHADLEASVEEQLAWFKTLFPTPRDFVDAVENPRLLHELTMRELERAEKDGHLSGFVCDEMRTRMAAAFDGRWEDAMSGVEAFVDEVNRRGTRGDAVVVGTWVGSARLGRERFGRPNEKYTSADYTKITIDTLVAMKFGPAGGAASIFVMVLQDSEGCCGEDGAWGLGDDLSWGW